ncbi:UDP-3-O-(3-hydroxymyristoyl)glucosamine N-acyltransferase [subsurface metagenome]
MQDLFIFPFNGNGIEALTCLDNKLNFIGFIDDAIEKQGKHEYGFYVYSKEILTKFPKAKVLAVPGSPTSYLYRDDSINQLNLNQEHFTQIIHSNAIVSPFAKIGFNVLIMAGVVITSNAIIGNHVCILPNTVIHHDCKIGNYTLIGSSVSIAGHTNVGEKCFIGSGSRLINNIEIGNETLIGLGSNIIKRRD